MSKIPGDILKDWDIVVIDDEGDSLEVARYILDFYGANVHTANGAQDGLNIIRSVRPRFVISDISMPLMDGWDLIKALKEDPSTRDVPAIALTAHAMPGDRERAVSAGFHNYLTKPLTADTFMDQLIKLLIDIPVLSEQLNLNL